MNNNQLLSKKCILYIDDNAASIEAALAIFEDDYNYSIISETSVEEGIETLSNYYGTIDAIILDLSFPNTKMQGKEGLKIIKEKYGWIPVFILTGSTNPEENTIAQECLLMGAEQVFHKSVFDVKVFMDKVSDAAHRENISEQLRTIKDYTSRNVVSPYFHITDHKSYVHGAFAFKLDALISDLEPTAYATWSKELSQVLQLFPWVQTTQVYRNENGKISCYFLFILLADDKQSVLARYNDFFFNISAFFNDTFTYQPAAFIPATNVDVLLELIIAGRSNKMAQVYEFVRSYKEIENTSSKGIGFSSDDKEKVTCGIPLPYEGNNDKFDVLFHHLRTMPDLVVMNIFNPVKLNIKEIATITRAKDIFTGDSLKPYRATANKFIEQQRELFTLKTVCVLPKKKIQTALTLINNSFYSGKATAKISLQGNWSNYQKKYERVKNFVTKEELSNIIRLPQVADDFQTSFTLDQVSQHNVPLQAFDIVNITLGNKKSRTIGIEPKQFQKHTYIIGKTGTGKTSVLKSMIQNRMESGYGLALIDPHGDIYQNVLESVPEHRKKDIILFDPIDPDNNFGFNYFQYDKNYPEQRSFIVSELLKIFEDIYDMKSAGGPMFELYFKNTAYLVMETLEKATLDDMSRVLENTRLLDLCLEKSKDNRVKSFFSNARRMNGEQSFENFAPYISSKLTRFTDNLLLRNVLCDANKNVDFRRLIDENKILLVKLNKARLSNGGVGFLGRLLFNKIVLAAYTREDIPEEKRKEFSLFIDEFQNFTSNDIVSALGEVRKYKMQIVLANQTFAQLDERVAKNILGNVGSLITAAVSPYDAEMIAPYLEPEFTKQDIVHLDNYKFILSSQYNNKRVSPFIFNSIPY